MTAKRRLVPRHEIIETLELLREFGIPIHAVDIRHDGISVSALPERPNLIASDPTDVGEPENAFDKWKRENQGDVRVACG